MLMSFFWQKELVQLFTDMSLLLDTQQEMVNTIEAQVENTAVYVEEGSKQVAQAIEYRKKSRRVRIARRHQMDFWRGESPA